MTAKTKTKQVSFRVSREDWKLIEKIVDRAQAAALSAEVPFDRLCARMDITAVHANGTPLKLAELLGADDFDFNHDVFGIFRHIDRQTGALGGCFLPRTAASQ